MPSPASELHWPAEWAPHAATWLVWPHNADTWPDRLPRIPAIFAQMVRALLPGESVEILVRDAAEQAAAELVLTEHRALGSGVRFHHIVTNDSWIRDHGPVFVRGASGKPFALDWEYNAWGGKYPDWAEDAQVARRVAEKLEVEALRPGMVLEGGSIEGDGCGTILTTESCLLHPNRNPELDRAAVEQQLRRYLGAEKVLWLAAGIAGDDTDGHVDDLTRFVARGRVVTVVEDRAEDENYRVLCENRERLEGMQDAGGQALEIIDLPMPSPVVSRGLRLPASYANFYVANGAVLVPTFEDPQDRRALGVLTDLFPDRAVVGIPARDLVLGLGACHCLTQQQPAGPPSGKAE